MLTSITKRLQDLEDNVFKDLLLLKKYEDLLRIEDDPKRQVRYENEIQQLQKSSQRYQKELDGLRSKISNDTSIVGLYNIDDKLDQINSNLRLLQKGQVAILGQLDQTRLDLVKRYDTSQRVVITAIVQGLNQHQIIVAQALLDTLETDHLPESDIQDLWGLIEKKVLALPSAQSSIINIIKDPTLDAKHKLKLSIPIIPFILDYEGELELGNGLNIGFAWEWVKTKLRPVRS